MNAQPRQEDVVGPVLVSGEVADAIVAAIFARNPDAQVVDRGSYLRVSSPGRCTVERLDVEEALGRAFSFPTDLELVMTSFSGRFVIDAERAEWTS